MAMTRARGLEQWAEDHVVTGTQIAKLRVWRGDERGGSIEEFESFLDQRAMLQRCEKCRVALQFLEAGDDRIGIFFSKLGKRRGLI